MSSKHLQILVCRAHNVLDLHLGNIAFELPCLDSWTVEQVHERFGEPSTDMISRLDGQPLGPEAPPYTVRPAYFWTPGEEGLMKPLKIIDFGEASFFKGERKKMHSPMLLRPPNRFSTRVLACQLTVGPWHVPFLKSSASVLCLKIPCLTRRVFSWK